MGQQFSKRTKRHMQSPPKVIQPPPRETQGSSKDSSKGTASPKDRAEDMPMPSTIDLSANVPSDLKVLDGRLFKKSGSPIYPFPNDKEELLRLNVQHFIIQRLLLGNYLAPVTESLKSGIKVLDVGCGTGVWSFELATEFPNSTFLGTDITNVFLATADQSPPNLKFLEADTVAGLPFEDNTFDYVFQRLQSGNFSVKTWPVVLKELLRVAKPGAYVELVDACAPNYGGPAFMIHRNWFATTLELRDVDSEIFAEPSVIIDAGFVDLVSKYITWPISGGPDATINEWSSKNWSNVIDSTRPLVTASLGISDSEYDDVAERAKKEIADPDSGYMPYTTIYSHYGRKAAV